MPKMMMNVKSRLQSRFIKAWVQVPLPGWLRSLILWVALPKYLVGAVAVIFDSQGRILLFHHTYRSDCPWGLPSGWLKRNELAHKALERELLEESGYEIRVNRSVVVGGDRLLNRLDLYFECELIGGKFQPSPEVDQAAFFDVNQVPECLEPFHREVVNYTACHPVINRCRDDTT